MKNYGQYLKAIVGVIGAGLAGLQQAFPGAHWVSIVTLVLVPVLVYLVPNMPAPAAKAARPETVPSMMPPSPAQEPAKM